MAEQLSAEKRATALVVKYGRDGTLHDTRQWIELAIIDAEKQARAEVLAACLEAILRWRNRYGATPEGSPVFLVATQVYNLLLLDSRLQPAASDLEEYVKNLPLSEIARIKGLYGLASVNKPEVRPVFHATEDE